VLRAMMPEADAAAVTAAADRIRTAPAVQGQRVEGLLSPTVRRPLMLAFLIAFFNQLSGINAVLYFAPRIFGLTGSENALGQSIGIGITNLVFTFAGLWLIDRLGRRTLLYIGSLGYILSLGLCAAAFFHWAPQFRAASAAVDLKNAAAALASANPARVDALRSDLSQRWNALAAAAADPRSGAASVPLPASFDPVNQREAAVAAATEVLTASSRAAGPGGTIVLLCIFAFIAAHAIGQGAVIWVFLSEIFPDSCRAAGQALGSATHWVFAALLTTVFPLLMAALPPGAVFLIFTGMMILQLIWVKAMVPETKGIPLEDIARKLGSTG
jgi:hypothetical protein